MNTAVLRHYLERANDRGFLGWLPDKYCLYLLYWVRTGRRLNLKNPQRYNEKLQWLKLYNRNPIYTTMVDKYEVKQYIADKVGEEYVIPALGVWERFDQIDFAALPNQFVLKCTHDSGGLVIVRDKASFDVAAAKAKIEKSLKTNYYLHSREWPYKHVRPRIIAEAYIEDAETAELRDYKWFCFHGVPKILGVFCGRAAGTTTADFFDSSYGSIDMVRGFPKADTLPGKPKSFEKMKELAAKLSEEMPCLRVDFYEVNGNVYVGELTFFPSSGFALMTPDKWDEQMGSWITLPTR